MTRTAYKPVLVIGMHRSGTGLLAGILHDLGVHMGFRREPNNESTFFLHLNEHLLRATGASWEQPQPFLDAWQEEGTRHRLVTDIRRRLRSPATLSYLGPRGFRATGSLESLDSRWGWKDPRNTYTLPLWLEIFPGAKIIHLYRNGVDVAASLKTRSEAYFRRRDARTSLVRSLARLRTRFVPLSGDSGLCRKLAGGFGLWERYTRLADAHLAALGENRGLALCYEDLLTEPDGQLEALCRFSGAARDRKKLESIAARFRPGKAYRYESNAELRRFYETVKDNPQMRRYSYA